MPDDLVASADNAVGPYRLLELLGSGSLAAVWRAYDSERGRTVALKRFAAERSEDPGFRDRFHRAARTVGRLTSPHVLPVHDFGELNGRLFLDTRLVEGGNLEALLRAHPGGLAPGRAVEIGRQIAAALDSAHEAGAVHGDVKPSNVLLESGDPHEFCYLADFGIAGAASPDGPDAEGATSASTPPELFRGEAAVPASDVYSLGCLLFAMLTGRAVFAGPPMELMDQHLFADPPRPSSIRADLAPFDPVVATALAKNPARRFPSAGALVDAARAAPGGGDAAARGRLPLWRRPLVLSAAIGALVVFGVVLAVPALPGTGTPAGPQAAPAPLPPVAFHLPPGLASTGDIAISRDGSTLYTLRTGRDGALTVIDEPTGTVRNVVPVGTYPEDVAVGADGSRVYVVNNGTQGFPGKTLSVVDTAVDRVVATVPVGNFPNSVKVSPDGARVYAANSGTLAEGGGGMTTIDATTNAVVGSLPIRPVPNHFAVSPDGRHLYVPNGSSTITPGSSVSDVDTTTNMIVRTFPVGIAPRATAVSPDGRHVWVASAGDPRSAPRGSLDRIDLDSGQVTAIGPQAVENPRGVAVSPDGSTVVATDNGALNAGAVPGNAVLIIDTVTGAVRRSVVIGGEPKQIAFSPDGHDVFISAMGPGDVWRIPLTG